jgi:uncharacterized protein YuzE
MKITYDPEVEVLRLLFSNAPIEESDEDKDGNIVMMEFDSHSTNNIGMKNAYGYGL